MMRREGRAGAGPWQNTLPKSIEGLIPLLTSTYRVGKYLEYKVYILLVSAVALAKFMCDTA